MVRGLFRGKLGTILGNHAVMLSEALQRNAKHEARLSNISDIGTAVRLINNQRFFASVQNDIHETFCRRR